MVDLSTRAREPELLDEGVAPDEVIASLADLRFVNSWLGNRSRVLNAIRPYLPRPSTARPLSLLDVGCGSADLSLWLRTRTSPPVQAVGVDIKLLHLAQAPSEVPCVAADARRLPFASGAFDVVTASLFLHHFDGPDVTVVLQELFRVAGRALIIADLRRALVPYAFGRVAFPLMFKSRVSVSDGLTSIRRAFTAREFGGAFAAAGIKAHVTRTTPYGLFAVARKAT